jgi:ATP/ADP translocase
MQHRHGSAAGSSATSGAAISASSSRSSSHSPDELEDSLEEAVAVPPEKKKLSVMEAFSFLAASKQVRCLALMALAQGISTNLLEVRAPEHMVVCLHLAGLSGLRPHG